MSPVRGWDSVMVVSVVDSIIVSTTRSGWPVPPPLSHTNYPDYLVYWILEPGTTLATHHPLHTPPGLTTILTPVSNLYTLGGFGEKNLK